MRLKWYGWLGLGIVIVAEICLFARQPFVATWFTPIVWSGYILFADALALRLRGHSLLHDRPREALMMTWISVGCWLLFEVYNLRLQNWGYVGVPERPLERDWAFLWSFATIMPGLFETADVLAGLGFLRDLKTRPRALSPLALAGMIVAGLACVAIPPLLPVPVARYTFGLVWLGFIFLLEPINMQLGVHSPLAEWARGDPRPALRLLGAGMVCGFLWEFWNFWAAAGWRYFVPWPLDFGVYYFRMPVLGLLGFPPFAWESWAMFQLLKRALRGDVLWK
ncbi:MAG: hypothetical protein DRJ03_20965 [Chloroflexi bacterium]|nr:MAG: hypothetical protein B6I35_06750 [Anaerolineaceae bacterium 4572_32.2]RLC75859.1 MAG: hypothetical protein DRI81_11185 [Chloroflexota bacterium]RLC80793.1 MAG: hypothetical protein DRJ03_20965 [Chloroflexota bacterium]HEY72720.1 hypothetical protein [Thermoflexia bacterium]